MRPGDGWSRMEVLITEDDWRVCDFSEGTGSWFSVQHSCAADRDGWGQGWITMYYYREAMEVPCCTCGQVPPDGIQGVFAMLTWDQE